MTMTTPIPRPRSHSRSRPTTPLRASSRSSLRTSHTQSAYTAHTPQSHPGNPSIDHPDASTRPDSYHSGAHSNGPSPLDILEPQFAELSDSMADLEGRFMDLSVMGESLARFGECFAGFLYGLEMNAFCVDFGEAPIAESFRRAAQQDNYAGRISGMDRFQADDGETTFMTSDTSFVDNPPASTRSTPKFQTPAPTRIASASSRGGAGTRGGAGRGGARGSGLARARGRGVR